MATSTGPVHPGEILEDDFLKPMGLSRHALALAIGIPAQRLHEIVHGRRTITADTALRLAAYFGTTPTWWLNMQTDYDLRMARAKVGAELARIQPRQGSLL
jgi:antitoxin HigA-1